MSSRRARPEQELQGSPRANIWVLRLSRNWLNIALVLLLIWVMGLLAQRVGSQARNDAMMIDPQELRRLREQAEARREAAAEAEGPKAGA